MMVTVTSRLFSPYLRDRAESYLKKFAKRAKTQTPVEWRIDEKTLTGKVFRKNQSGTFLDTDGTRYSLAKTPRMIRLTSSTLTHAELTALNHRRPLPPETFDARYLPHPMLQIVVDYEPPSDWQVVAVCDPSDPNEPTGSPAIWTPMFGEKLPERIGRRKLPEKFIDHCDHCTSGPRRRKRTLIVRSPKGQTKIVGSTCLLSYTGISPDDLEKLMNIATRPPPEEAGGGYFGGRAYTTTHPTSVLNDLVAAYALKNRNYRSGMGSLLLNGVAEFHGDEVAVGVVHMETKKFTETFRIANVWPKRFKGRYNMEDLAYLVEPTPDSQMLALSFASAIEAMKDDRPSEFSRKVLSVAESGMVYKKTWNVYAGASSRWLKTVHAEWFDAVEEAKPKETTKRLPHDVGERITVKCRFVEQRITRNGYTLTEFVTDKNEAIVSFGKFDYKRHGLKPNDRITLTGTVKRHGSFKDNESTTLNRLTVEAKE